MRGHANYRPLEDMTPLSVQGANGVVAIKCISREKGYYAYVVLDFPNYRLKTELAWDEELTDDGAAEFVETTLAINRFFWDWNYSGCLEVWADGTECLGRCDAFIPVNIMLDPTTYEEVTKLKAEITIRPRRSQPLEPRA